MTRISQLPAIGTPDVADLVEVERSDGSSGHIALASLLDDLLIQSGTVTVTGDGSDFATEQVTFDVPYDATPVVVATVAASGTRWAVVTGANTATGFQIGLFQWSGGTFTTARLVNWIAVGPKPA